ncbi:MAG: NAD(P)/FAD-dependent oxidoreductase [Actinomycetota bacterium]|nr:NAD(P)/FAD-dependent oxidoreductase [Actinomycetota bacterium]
MNSTYDAVVIGGGHNALVCAAYLGRAGHKVVVLERRHILGGAAATEELWPGYKVSTASYVVSLMSNEIERELDLAGHGYHVYPIDPSAYYVSHDGPGILLWDEPDKAARAISKLSGHDADAYLRYSRDMSELAALVRPLLFRIPPDVGIRSIGELREATGLGRYTFAHRKDVARLVDLMTLSVADFLDRYFEHEAVKGALAFGGVIGSWGGPMSPGSAYVLLHHRMGEAGGVRGGWGFVRGGMGALSIAIADAARAAGVEIRTEADVASVDIVGGRARGVTLRDGSELRGRAIVSGTHPTITFRDLVGETNLPDALAEEMRHYRTRGSSAKVNLAISELPDFTAVPGTQLGPQHPEFVISPSVDYLEQAWDDAKYGRPSARPMVDCVIPSTLDPTLAPEGKYVATCFVQYSPERLAQGTWDEERDALGDRVIDAISEYAPNFKKSVEHRQVLTPVDLEERFGLIGGNIFHGEMSLDQLFSFRPAPGVASYRTPVDGLYLCGSGAHPGGGVMGIPGLNASKVVAKDLKPRRWARR